MALDSDNRLLALLWGSERFRTAVVAELASQGIRLVETGTYDEQAQVAYGACTDGEGGTRTGELLVGRADAQGCPRPLLRLMTAESEPLFLSDGSPVPQAVVPVPARVRRTCNRLQAGAALFACGTHLHKMGTLHVTALYTALLYERMARKCADLLAVRDRSNGDWTQTFHEMLLRVMGDERNREAFQQLGRRATYAMILRERELVRVEALLIGLSGLLDRLVPHDEYRQRLAGEFRYLASKYRLSPLRPEVWELGRIRPYNHPLLRLAQIARLLTRCDLLFDRVVACRTAGEVRTLFGVEASPYWADLLAGPHRDRARIGAGKADLLGINLVAPLKFAYASFTANDALCREAMALLEGIPPEVNRFVRGWRGEGAPVRNAFESQAVLQLSRAYCAEARCAECPLGRGVIKKSV